MESEEKSISVEHAIFYWPFTCLWLYVMIGKLLALAYIVKSLFMAPNPLTTIVICFVVCVVLIVLMTVFMLPVLVISVIIKSMSKVFNIANVAETPKVVTKPFDKSTTTTYNITFNSKHFTYADRDETQNFELASIDKIVLFGNNSQNKSLNIYYDKDKIYTFYSDMKDWKGLLERLNAHFNIKIDVKTINNKQVLYERKS